jgi:hypothetical protein
MGPIKLTTSYEGYRSEFLLKSDVELENKTKDVLLHNGKFTLTLEKYQKGNSNNIHTFPTMKDLTWEEVKKYII